MASSKKNKTAQDQAIAAKRVEFVKANPQLDPAEARKRFFVQTRAGELQAKGVEVTKQKRQELRQKFSTGGVQRQGFYTPGDLQRIAAAKAASSKVGNTTTTTTGSTSATPSSRPQDLADYKNTVYSSLAKENTARRPVAPKATTNNKFDEQSFNPAQFLKSPLVKGVKGAAKGVYNIAESSAESFNATFINPTVNLVGKAIGKNPNLRQAGAMEATINTGYAILDIGTLGLSRSLSAASGPIVKGLIPAKQGIIKSTASKLTSKIAAGGKSQIVRGTEEYAEQATKAFAKAPKTGSVDLATGVYQPLKNAKGKVIVPKSKAFPRGLDETPSFLKTPKTPKPTGSKVTGIDEYVSDALQRVGKGQKTGSVDLATGKYNPPSYSKMKDIDVDLKFGNAAEKSNAKKAAAKLNQTKPKASTPKPAAAKPAAPKAAKPKIDRFANAWDDSPVDMSKVDFSEFGMESSKPYATGKRAAKKKAAPKVEAPAAPKPAPKTTAPKANAKAAFDKSVAPIKTGSQTKLTFKTQADYNQFLKTGGKERLRQMSPELRTSFERVNERWIKGAAEAREVTQAAQKRSIERALATKGRYNRARPELKGLFNQALIKRQERELLAKVTKKK